MFMGHAESSDTCSATNLSWLDYDHRGCRVVTVPTYLRLNCILDKIKSTSNVLTIIIKLSFRYQLCICIQRQLLLFGHILCVSYMIRGKTLVLNQDLVPLLCGLVESHLWTRRSYTEYRVTSSSLANKIQ